MLAKRIIPCLDVRDGRTVKGVKFIDIRDAGDAVELGTLYAEQGADELAFLDITATVEGREPLAALVKRISARINIPFTVGGGIKSVADVGVLLDSGADKITVNSEAVVNPGIIDMLAAEFGSQCVVYSADVRHNGYFWEVYIHGGRTPTGIKAQDWIRQIAERGAGEVLLTSMDNDGTKRGFAVDFIREISESVTVPVIASGGAGTMAHFVEVLSRGKADAALAASLFHFGEIEIPVLKGYLRDHGVPIRNAFIK